MEQDEEVRPIPLRILLSNPPQPMHEDILAQGGLGAEMRGSVNDLTPQLLRNINDVLAIGGHVHPVHPRRPLRGQDRVRHHWPSEDRLRVLAWESRSLLLPDDESTDHASSAYTLGVRK